MENMEKAIGGNVLHFRMLRGMKQDEIAEKIGISRNAYRAIECGDSAPKVSTLQNIADAFGVKISDLLHQKEAMKSLRFRSQHAPTAKERFRREQVVRDFCVWLKDFNMLEDCLDNHVSYKLEEGSVKGRKNSPVDIAKDARKILGLDDKAPINDICGLIESAGVKICQISSELKGFFGFSVGKQDGGPAVCVNILNSIPVERQIFTAAHEFGHLLLHPNSFKTSIEDEDDAEEKEANVFASYFLMPEKAFTDAMEENRGLYLVDAVLHIKRRFKVSYRTVLYRLSETGRADKSIWPTFCKEYKRMYGKDLAGHREPDPLSSDISDEPKSLDNTDFIEDRFSRLVREAYEKEEITTSRAAEMLKIRIDEMRQKACIWAMVR